MIKCIALLSFGIFCCCMSLIILSVLITAPYDVVHKKTISIISGICLILGILAIAFSIVLLSSINGWGFY